MKTVLIAVAVLAALAVAALLVFVYVVQNVEQPSYGVERSDGDFEVRDYPGLVVAEVERKGSRKAGLSAGFGRLAAYIFARERGGEPIAMTAPVQQSPLGADDKIAMTAPVTQSSTGDDRWLVQFVMPSEYAVEQLPRPASDVRLRELPPRRLAVVRFSGRTDDRQLEAQQRRLREWMARNGLEAAGAAVYAYYNDPLTPGFLRRNEVMIPLR